MPERGIDDDDDPHAAGDRMAGLAADVARLQGVVADLREALAHALAVAAHEQRLRQQAQDTAARAWRVTTTWPRRADRPGA